MIHLIQRFFARNLFDVDAPEFKTGYQSNFAESRIEVDELCII
jgi:hypothetical protein